MSRFDYYPLHDTGQTNFKPPEESTYRLVGYPSGLKVPSDDHNGKLGRLGSWVSVLDTTTLSTVDWLDGFGLLSASVLSYAVGQTVKTGAALLTRGTYLVDGARIETSDDYLNPVPAGVATGSPLMYPTATAPGRIWIYGKGDGTVRFESVGVGVADSPAADEQALAGVDIDGVGVITANVSPTTQPLLSQAIPIVAPVTITGSGTMLAVTGGSAGGDPAATFGSTVVDVPAIEATAIVNNTATGVAAFFGKIGRALYALSEGPEPGARFEHSGAGAAASIVTTGSGDGLTVDSSGGSGRAIDAVGPAGAQVVRSTCDTGAAFRAEVTSTGAGFDGLGGPSATSLAVRGVAQHTGAFAVQGTTAAGASAIVSGVRGIGLGDASGLQGIASGDGYGAILQADPSSPSRASLRLVPQDADPLTKEQGALLFHDGRGPTGKLRTCTTQWESVHSSDKGWVRQWGLAASGGPIGGGSGNLSSVQITPEEVGTVLVTATGSINYTTDSANVAVRLDDLIAAVTLASQNERAIYTDGVGPNTRSFVIRAVYTLPSTATRTFAAILSVSSGSVNYAHVVVTVEGVQ